MHDQSVQISLFNTLRQHASVALPMFRASKATLVDLSHTLEDCIIANRLPSVIFTGFQESSHWREETARYLELAGIASQICIFAGGSPPVPDEQHIAITLEGDDPLRQEWFLLILTDFFSAVLCGQDLLADVEQEADRLFDAFLSFDPVAVQQVITAVLPVVERYRPERAAELARAVASFPPRDPGGHYVTQLVARIVAHMQRRHDQQRGALLELTALREREDRLEAIVAELGVPVIPVLDGVVVLPLVGSMDRWRAQQVMESLLEGIAAHQADVAIIDITGVPVVDTAVASSLTQSMKAASLLGTQVILSGIKPQVAQTLVALGVELSGVRTVGQLREAITLALAVFGLTITSATANA